ncbi:hypothetical protein CN327_29095 [Bacillus cereus]|nr:hypothetical protein CON53_30920 [Bacillus cereus]PFF27615.1 hypothetical protein CN327_29095 [Bacillus cereus]PFH93572.1 hypothetical protein COI81_01780 [Bacillus cereus]PGS22141.1 hypothetical protein COC55_22790 [Bacillus cereus]
MNTYKSIKKVLLVGITAIALLSGCGNDTKQDPPKDAEKDKQQVAKNDAKEKIEKTKKENEAKEAEAKAPKASEEVEIQRFNTCDSQGKYCERGMLNIGAFNALKVGMSPQEVTQKLGRNAERAVKTTMNGVEVIEYTYRAPQTTVQVDFKDGVLYYASHVDSKMKVTTLDGTKAPTEDA